VARSGGDSRWNVRPLQFVRGVTWLMMQCWRFKMELHRPNKKGLVWLVGGWKSEKNDNTIISLLAWCESRVVHELAKFERSHESSRAGSFLHVSRSIFLHHVVSRPPQPTKKQHAVLVVDCRSSGSTCTQMEEGQDIHTFIIRTNDRRLCFTSYLMWQTKRTVTQL